MGEERHLDRIGIAASVACAIHCAAFPMLAVLLPVFGARGFGHPGVEWILLTTSFAVGSTSVVRSAVHIHRRWEPVALFSTGIVVLLLKRTLAEGTRVELPVAVIGACLLILAHAGNIVACRRCAACRRASVAE